MNTKILFILHIPPPVHGSSVVGQYIKKSKIINNAFECNYINLGTSRTVDEIGKNLLPKIGRYLSIIVQVLNQLLTNKPQLCYLAITAKGTAFYKDTLIVLLIKLFGVRIVYHFHNKGVKTNQHKPFDNFLYRIVFNNTHAILLSKYLYPDVQKYFSVERVHYCPNGIPDIDKRHKIQEKQHDKNNEIVKILFLSNLIESKGVFILLEACKILNQKDHRFKSIYVGGEGDVNEQQFQEKVKKLELTEQVAYVGKKYGSEKASVFASADIFAFPTYYYYECLPLVLLESMQHSLPIVSTFEGGIPDIIEDGVNGFLVKQKDVFALADKLEVLINNSLLRQKMGNVGRIKYEQEFTLKIFEQKLTKIIRNILNQTS